MRTEATIKDIMNTNPVITKKKASVLDVVKEMKGEGVGSIIVVENGKPIGVITESDILRKVVAEGKNPSKIMVEEIMSFPPVTVTPETRVEDAIKIMGEKKIRRLPVVKDGKLVGMATERDLLQISPLLLDVVRELASITHARESLYKRREFTSAKCEDCGMFSDKLIEINGRLICESCAETYK